MKPNDIIFNEFGRVRSGFRFILFLTAFIVLSIAVTLMIFGVAERVTGNARAFLGSRTGMLITSATSLFLATTLGWAFGKVLENLPLKALGWVFNRTWLKDFAIGMILGVLTISIAVVLAMPSGGIGLVFNSISSPNAIIWSFAASFLVFFVAAAFEEVLFRGYILQTLMRGNLTLLGILVTSLPFAFAHLGNPGANLISSVNTGLAGIWFGVAFLKTRSLWLAFGLHLSWNWFQGAFFGISVSGLTHIAPDPLFKTVDAGPDWLTGGAYGVEAGLVCTVSLLLSMAVIWFAPFLKPTDDMVALTSREIPQNGQA